MIKEYIKSNPIKFIIGIISIPGAIWGAIKVGNEIKTTIKDNILEQNRKEQLDSIRWSKVDQILFIKDSLNSKLDTLLVDRKYIRKQLRAARSDINILNNSVEKHLLNSQKYDELYQMMKERQNREDTNKSLKDTDPHIYKINK
jgi:outer membrane murein-binding lipoprotein Lpp